MELIVINGEPYILTPVREVLSGGLDVLRLAELCRSAELPPSVQAAASASPLRLRFFTASDTHEKQETLRQAIRSMSQSFNVNAGRDWIALYIAFTYSQHKVALVRKFGLFFSDIETLVPDLLTHVKPAESGYNRYDSLAESLSGECRKWYVCNGCLPAPGEWTLPSYRYQVDNGRRKLVQETVAMLGRVFACRNIQ